MDEDKKSLIFFKDFGNHDEIKGLTSFDEVQKQIESEFAIQEYEDFIEERLAKSPLKLFQEAITKVKEN